MTPETAKLVAQAEQLLAVGFTGANSRDPNCLALLDCVLDKGNAGRLSLLPTGLSFDSEGSLLNVHMHDLLHVSLQETNHSDVALPLSIPKSVRIVEAKGELVRMQRLLVESRDASRLLGGSSSLSDSNPIAPSAKLEEIAVDDTFLLLEKRVVVVQRLVLDGAAHSAMVPALSELRFVTSDPNDALEFSILLCGHLKAYWAQKIMADVRKASGTSNDTISLLAPVVALQHTQGGFFGGKSDDVTQEIALVCVCSKGIVVGTITLSSKVEQGYVIDKWRFVDYTKLGDITLSCDDPLEFSLTFAKGSAWEPFKLFAGSPTLRWELCSTIQRKYHACCSGKYLAPNLFAEKLYPASWAEMRALTQSSAEMWLSRTGVACLKFGRQGEPQVRIIMLNTADSSLFWNSGSKKKDPLSLAQVAAATVIQSCLFHSHNFPGAKF
jgi:hypothetical protein